MIELTEDLFIGAGKRRRCYHHPDDPGKCIKVSTITEGRDMQTRREIAYYNKYARRGCDLSHISTFHGIVETNLGPGAVFDLIRNPDGQISPELGDVIKDGTSVADLKPELDQLRDYMFREGIICGDFNHGNLLLQEQPDGSRRLMIIDGLGNSDFIKLADIWKTWCNRKLERKWAHLMWRLGTFEEKARAKS